MFTTVDERVERLLRRHGWTAGELLGAGMEGTVLSLSADAVAKVWHGRSHADIQALASFGSAVATASLPFAVPYVMDLLEDDELTITIERRISGTPLRLDGGSAPPGVTADDIRLLGDVLEGFSRGEPSPGLASLPILPGDRPFTWPGSFTESLADLVERRFQATPHLLQRDLDQAEATVAVVAERLRGLEPAGETLVHGDLIPANVLIEADRISGVLDFGFLTTVGDPQFDAAITASIFDMYGPHARASEEALTEAFLDRFGHDGDTYGLYRAAYAIITNAYFGQDGLDGHYLWCVRMLRRPDVTAALLG
jgi:hypothetical protein